jgi:hypothetical protein
MQQAQACREERVKRAQFLFGVLSILALLTTKLSAQETPKPENKVPASTLKVQVTFTESQGEKKLANLPYTFYVQAGERGISPFTKVRMGSRIPVYVGKDAGMQYIDIGTNIDARGFTTEGGKFDVILSLERAWVEGDVAVPAEKSVGNPTIGASGQFYEPIIRQFKTELTLTMKDGQTIQTTQAADPLSGRILTISVVMNVVK